MTKGFLFNHKLFLLLSTRNKYEKLNTITNLKLRS